jgi:peptide/nickel transport system ATP-binding protein
MLLEVAGLNIATRTVTVVRELSFSLDRGETLGIVGESGSGKTMTALALIGLLPEGVRASGAIRFDGRKLLPLDEATMESLRGAAIAMIFQEPMTALNPLHKIARQIAEPLRLHRNLEKSAALARAAKLLAGVGLPERAGRAYPHMLSGGQRQRALIAMALSCEPQLVIADEPTTALDVTVQAQILEVIASLRAQHDMALILISHDLAIVAQQCQRVLVMYGGMAVESGLAADVLGRPAHPYTRALLDARPDLGAPRGARLRAIRGTPPSITEMPAGCLFAPRCPYAISACTTALPALTALPNARQVRCIRVDADGRLA